MFFRSIAQSAAIAIFAVSTITVSDAAFAADVGGNFAVRGSGAEACSKLSKAFETKDAASIERYAAWIFGYASATNKLSPQTFDVSPAADGRDILALVLSVCTSKPAISVEVATAAVFSTLNAIRLTQAGTVIRFTDQGKTFDAREETVRFVERKLKAAGLYKEEETGKASAALMTAIKKFQVSQKLNSTGFPDIRTLLRLAAQK
jgi:hypothetical protein